MSTELETLNNGNGDGNMQRADLAELRSLIRRMERLLAPGERIAVNPDGTPGQVAPGELIESAWGNAVVNTLLRPGPILSAAGGTVVATGLGVESTTLTLYMPAVTYARGFFVSYIQFVQVSAGAADVTLKDHLGVQLSRFAVSAPGGSASGLVSGSLAAGLDLSYQVTVFGSTGSINTYNDQYTNQIRFVSWPVF